MNVEDNGNMDIQYHTSKLERRNVEDVMFTGKQYIKELNVLYVIGSWLIDQTRRKNNMFQEDKETFHVNGYMVYHSINKGWVCDCKGFLFGSKCKHIEQVIKEYGLER